MEIHENNLEHLDAFIRLNEQWITEYFSLEEADRKLAANPGQVIEDSGYIFSITEKNEVVGVCALFSEGDGVYELARMAVSPDHQGKGIGDRLMTCCLAKARALSAKTLYLVSNTKLGPAISLYKKHGFVATHTGKHPLYSRANIVMELKDT